MNLKALDGNFAVRRSPLQPQSVIQVGPDVRVGQDAVTALSPIVTTGSAIRS